MTWVAWRQHRNQLLFAATLVGAWSVLVIVAGIHAHAELVAIQRSGCSLLSLTNGSAYCQSFSKSYYSLVDSNIGALGIGLPGILGVLLGAPLIAREMETGTFRTACTQSVSRVRWLLAKLAMVGSGVLILTVGIDIAYNWWVGPVGPHGWLTPLQVQFTWAPYTDTSANRLASGIFDLSGVVPIGYGMFAFAVGSAAGAVIRKTGIAMAAALGCFTAVRVFVAHNLRPNFLHLKTVVGPSAYLGIPRQDWQVHAGFLPLDRLVPAPGKGWNHLSPPYACNKLFIANRLPIPNLDAQSVIGQFTSCIRADGLHYVVQYQPGSRFWVFQGIEVGIFLALAAFFVAVTVLAVRYELGVGFAAAAMRSRLPLRRRPGEPRRASIPSRPVVVAIIASSVILVAAASALVIDWSQAPVKSTSFRSPMHWSSPRFFDPGRYYSGTGINGREFENFDIGPSSISCTSPTFCAAVDARGNVLTFDGAAWSIPKHVLAPARGISPYISCSSPTFCAAVGWKKVGTGVGGNPRVQGQVTVFDGSTWSTPIAVDPGAYMESVSCPSSNFCAAADSKGSITTFDGSTWSAPIKIMSQDFRSISCVSAVFCVAEGGGERSAYLYNGAHWSPVGLDDGAVMVSCTSPTFCVSIDGVGYVSAYNGRWWSKLHNVDPAVYGVGGAWGFSAIFLEGRQVISCVSPKFCVVVSPGGDAFAFNGTTWSAPTHFDDGTVRAVSCPTTTFCAAVDQDGNVSFGRS